MNKSLLLLLALSVVINIYQFKSETIVYDDLDKYRPNDDTSILKDDVSIAQSAIQKKKVNFEVVNSDESESLKEVNQYVEESKDLDEIDAKEFSAKYEVKIEKWNDSVSDFIINDLGFRSTVSEQYHQARLDNQQKISKYFSDKNNLESDQYGDMQPDDYIFLGNTKKEYQNKLIDLFGKAGFNQLKKHHMEFINLQSKDDEISFYIEY